MNEAEKEYKITDLYIAAYLKALGHKCRIEALGKRCYFIFGMEVKADVSAFIQISDADQYNINANLFVNEIK